MNIVDIAKEAGVSKSTVSRVLIQPEKVAPETLERIREIMKRNNFKPRRHVARKTKPSYLESEKTGNIALLFPDEHAGWMNTPLSSAIIAGIEDHLYENGYNLILSHIREGKKLPKCIENKEVDGIIAKSGYDSEIMKTIASKVPDIPLACIFVTSAMIDRFDVICPDNIAIGEMAFQYLYELGHRSMMIMSPYAKNVHLGFKYRAVGFKKASLEKAKVQHIESSLGILSMAKMVDRYLAMDNPPSGIFCLGGDFQVEVIYKALADKGVKFFEGVDFICSFNDIARLNVLDYRLPYIDIHPDEIGKKAVDAIFQRIEKPEMTPQTIHVNAEIKTGKRKEDIYTV